MRVHIFMHVDFEGPGNMATWFATHGHPVRYTRFYEDLPALPELSEFDLLVIMGGPMSVNDELRFPWLIMEKCFIRSAMDADKGVLGVCLGAQLIASTLGSAIHAAPYREIGWYPVSAVSCPSRHDDRLVFPERIEVFHWHGETFDLPEGADLLASSRAVPNQAFQYGGKVVALQFHLETTQESAARIIENCREELVPGEYVQNAEMILKAPPSRYEAMHLLMGDVLDYLTRQ